MRGAGLDPGCFGFVTTAVNMTACKPHLSYFEQILAHENLRAEDCLMVGNEKEMDLPASQLGIPVYLLDPGRPLLTVGPRVWRGGFPELRGLLEG